MQYIFLIFFLLLTSIQADDTQQIEQILHDIKQLHLKNDILQKELHKQNNMNSQLKTKIKILEKKELCKKHVSENIFPDLEMKEQSTHFKAGAFRLKKDATIYDAINGNKLFIWESGVSFTSHTKTRQWMQITGYFVNKLWQSSPKEMWVQIVDIKEHK